MHPFIILGLGALVDTFGDILMRFWLSSKNIWHLIGGISFYALGMVFLVLSYKYESIAIASVIFVILNISMLLIASWLFFKEPVSTLQMLGLLLGTAAIIILEIS
jgi:multidrug transporter EmrE-like cation transporter